MKEKHNVPMYALMAVPRPGDRETRMRPISAAWLLRNQKEDTDRDE